MKSCFDESVLSIFEKEIKPNLIKSITHIISEIVNPNRTELENKISRLEEKLSSLEKLVKK